MRTIKPSLLKFKVRDAALTLNQFFIEGDILMRQMIEMNEEIHVRNTLKKIYS